MACVLHTLESRGFVHQTTDDHDDPARHRVELRRLLSAGPVTGYIGYDPTASSLHVGNLVTIMSLAHLQRAGHRPIAIVGGGTGLVGDPSGKQEMRQLLTRDRVRENLEAIRRQLGRYIELAPVQGPALRGKEGGTAAIILDNAEWLAPLNYLEFLRDYGRHFSVNRMLTHDCFKSRFASDAGLSFLEFNYMLLQAYDFLVLYREHGCRLQLGGSDQWGNIVAGMELIRRVDGEQTFGITFPLIHTADGRKMGKSESGAVWLDPARTSPYEFYQFWINTHDQDVGRFLRLFTFLDPDEIAPLERLEGAAIRQAKETLAFEATRITHGDQEATRARDAARALFGGGANDRLDAIDMPTLALDPARLQGQGIATIELCAEGKLCTSRNEARRLARQGGLYVNGRAVNEEHVVRASDIDDGAILLRAGKKRYLRVVMEG